MDNMFFFNLLHRLFGTLKSWPALVGIVLVCLQTGCSGTPQPAEEAGGDQQPGTLFHLEFNSQDSAVAKEIETYLGRGRQLVEAYFELSFQESVLVRICPTREAFTKSFPPEWGMPETQCWMVAAGVADKLIILSPRVWGEEACEHDPGDSQHVEDIVVHELVHSFHGQHNPTRDFTGAEEVGWFAEGLAVYVSGQLDRGHLADAREAVETGAVPARLADAWSGKYRYGVSGSIVAYMDAAFGRNRIRDMLAVTNQADLLDLAGVTERELLGQWQLSVMAP